MQTDIRFRPTYEPLHDLSAPHVLVNPDQYFADLAVFMLRRAWFHVDEARPAGVWPRHSEAQHLLADAIARVKGM